MYSIANQVFIALMLLLSYVYFFPRWADPNQNSRIDMIVAVVDDGTFMIDKYVGNTVDYAKVNGHYYSDKPPGSAFLGIPIYAGLKVILNTPVADQLVTKLSNNPAFQATLKSDGSGIYTDKVRFALAQVVLVALIPVVASILLGLLLYRCLIDFQISPVVSTVVVLIYGLLTPAFAYAGAYYSHPLTAFFLFAAFYLIRSASAVRPIRLAMAGVLLGTAVICEYSVILVAAILFIYAGLRLYRSGVWWKIVYIALPAGLIGAGLMVYNTAVFGGPFNLGYEYSELWTAQHQTGFMSLTLPRLDAVWGITFSPFRGLFFLSPILLLCLPGFYLWLKSRRYLGEFWVSIGVIVAMFLFNTSSIMWWGGFAIGPRYFLPAVPFLALAAGIAFQAWFEYRWFQIAAGILAVWSLLVNNGLTLAGQAFPPDTIVNPIVDYALPNWLSGNIARNMGTILGLKGIASLIPLAGLLIVFVLIWGIYLRKQSSIQLQHAKKGGTEAVHG